MKKKLLLLLILIISLTAGACGSANTDSPKEEEAATTVSVEVVVPENETETSETAQTATVTPQETHAPDSEDIPVYVKERAGEYYLNSMTQAGKEMNIEEIARVEGYGLDMLIRLNEDGTGVMKVFGEVWEFTWDDRVFQFEKEASDYFWSKKTGITFSKEGISYTFAAEKSTDLIKAEETKDPEQEDSEPDDEQIGEDKTEETPESSSAAIEIVGAAWVALADSKDKGLCIWYEFTNNTDSFLSPYAFTAEITQDEKVIQEGEVTLSDKEDIPENDFRFTEIQPGGKNRSIHLFNADPDGGKIEYTVKDSANNAVLLQQELDPKKLAGQPKKEFEPEAILDLEYLDKIPAKDVYNESYELAIKSSKTVLSELDGSKMIRVKFEFKNGSEEAVSPYLVVYLRAVQDGISLNAGWSSTDDPDLEKIYEEVEPGESVTFYYEWHLISDSPVAVEAYDWFSGETQLGRAFEVIKE